MAYRSLVEFLAGFVARLDTPSSSGCHHPDSLVARIRAGHHGQPPRYRRAPESGCRTIVVTTVSLAGTDFPGDNDGIRDETVYERLKRSGPGETAPPFAGTIYA